MLLLFVALSALARPVELLPVVPEKTKLRVTEETTLTADLGGGKKVVTRATTVTERQITQGGRLFLEEVAWLEEIVEISIEKQTSTGTVAWRSTDTTVPPQEYWDLTRQVGALYLVVVTPEGAVSVQPLGDGVEPAVIDARAHAISSMLSTIPSARLPLGSIDRRNGRVPDEISPDLVLTREWTLVHVDSGSAVLSTDSTLASPPDLVGGVWSLHGRGELTWDLSLSLPTRHVSQYAVQMRVYGQRRTVDFVEETTVEVIGEFLLSELDESTRMKTSKGALSGGTTVAPRTGKSRRP